MIFRLMLFLGCLAAIVAVAWGDWTAFNNMVQAADISHWGTMIVWLVGVIILTIIALVVFFFGIVGMIAAIAD